MNSSPEHPLPHTGAAKLAAHASHRSSSRALVAATAVLIALIAGSTFWLQSPELPGATASSAAEAR